jgi:hypothetical protein
MDISTEREIDPDLIPVYRALEYEGKKPKLVGTASLKSLHYWGDYDFFLFIGRDSADNAYRNITEILDRTQKLVYPPSLVFIECKIENEKEQKTRFKNLPINKEDFVAAYRNKAAFIKLDFVILTREEVRELSCIYFIMEEEKLTPDFIKSLNEDIQENKKSRDYYKAVKRYFSIYNYLHKRGLLKSTDNYIKIARYLNSSIGLLYSKTAQLKAIKLLIDNDKIDTPLLFSIIQTHLKNLRYRDLNKLYRYIQKNERIYNEDGRLFLKELDKLGK